MGAARPYIGQVTCQGEDALQHRLSFRRPYTGIEIFTINITIFLPIISKISIISYLFAFLRLYRLFPIFLPFYDHIDYFLSSYLLATTSTISYLSIFLRSHRLPTIDIHIVDLSKTTYCGGMGCVALRTTTARRGWRQGRGAREQQDNRIIKQQNINKT